MRLNTGLFSIPFVFTTTYNSLMTNLADAHKIKKFDYKTLSDPHFKAEMERMATVPPTAAISSSYLS